MQHPKPSGSQVGSCMHVQSSSAALLHTRQPVQDCPWQWQHLLQCMPATLVMRSWVLLLMQRALMWQQRLGCRWPLGLRTWR